MKLSNYKAFALSCLLVFACSSQLLADVPNNRNTQEEQRKTTTVKGKVVDEKGEALTGVTVLVKGSTTGTVTDIDGNFVLDDPSGEGSLVFSYIGYLAVEQAAGNNMQIVLKEDSQSLGEVLVTTQKRVQSNIEVPAAVSALSGISLKNLNLREFDEVAQLIPGVQIEIQSPNNPGYVIRGVTSDDGAAYAQPRVSVFQDGVSITRSRASVVELFDLERVEVVKGPQGTLFGRGAEIGAIHVIRNKPVDYLTGELTLGYGSYNQMIANGFINIPIVDGKLANRFAFSFDRHDGFVDNIAGGDLNGKQTLAFRNSTRMWAGDKTSLDLILDYQYDDYPGTAFKSNKSEYYADTTAYSAANLEQGEDLYITRHVGGATLLVDHDFSDNLQLSSITGFRAFKSDESFDADGTQASLLWCEEKAKGTQLSQEFRLNYTNQDWFSGFAGVSYFYEDSEQEVIARTNLQQLFPAYIYQIFEQSAKPSLEQFSGLISMISPYATALGIPSAAIEALQSGFDSLMEQWFPASYPGMTDGEPTTMATTPDFYGDIDNLLQSCLGMNLESVSQLMAAYMGTDISSTLESLQASSAIPLSDNYEENGTNYGTNQAAEIFIDGTFDFTKSLS